MNTLMPIDRYPDWEMRIKRQDAFWHNQIIDRPVISIATWSDNSRYPYPQDKADVREAWLDAEFVAARALASAMRIEHFGDSLPQAYPNLGPEVFSAWFGCELGFGENTVWSIPILEDWDDLEGVRFSTDSFYWQKIVEITDAYLNVGKGKFYTGITDLHPGGDAIAAFRDPARLNIDMIETPEKVKLLLEYVNQTFFAVYDMMSDKLHAAGQPLSSWPGIVSTKRWYVPSNDFSCMISKPMFDEVFLPGIREECRFLETSIYHLDGPNALHHLDSLLEIPELNAIQWVYGEGNGRASDWMHVYKRCQAAGKGLQITLAPEEVDSFMENLRPEGLWLHICGVRDAEEAGAIISTVSRWT